MAMKRGLLIMAAMILADPARADPEAGRLRAVLVGVADYRDSSLAGSPLVGARNDVLLMAETLLRRGARPADISLLVDHPERGSVHSSVQPLASPTRDAILAALRAVADTTRAGDQVLIQFSGHGDQQHERVAGNEPDGRDEAFLPADAVYDPAHLGDHETPIRNAIIDDEIGVAIDAIRDHGGNVFFIADFCHSGDSTRGGPRAETAAERRDRPVEAKPDSPGRGTLVSFFTARSDEQGGQRKAPFWDALGTEAHGVLSYYTITALNDPTIGSYDDLFQRVNGYILASNVALAQSNPAASLPAPEGTTSLPVLGRATGSASPGWSVAKPASSSEPVVLDHLDLPAGAMAGVTPGTIFSISTIGEKEETILYGRAATITPWATVVVPVSYGGIDAAAWRDIRATDFRYPEDGRVPLTAAASLFIRVVERPVMAELRVLPPDRSTARTPAQLAAVQALAAIDPRQFDARFVTNPAQSTLVLRFAGDTLDFRVAARAEARSYGRLPLSADPASDRTAIEAAIGRAARFQRAQAILADLAAQPQAADAPSALLDVQFYLRRPAARPAPDSACQPRAFEPGSSIPADARPIETYGYRMTTTPELQRCDEVYVRVRNAGNRPVHVSPMILAPEGAIYFLPTQDLDRVLYEPGRTGTGQYVLTTDVGSEPGRDDLTFVVLEVDPDNQASAIRRSLEQPGIVCADAEDSACLTAPSRGGGGGGSPAERAIIALLGNTRSAASVPHVGIRHYSWVTLPDRPAAQP